MVESRYPWLVALVLSATVATAHAQTLPTPSAPEPVIAPGPDSGANFDPNRGPSPPPLVAPVAPVAPPLVADPDPGPPVSLYSPTKQLARHRFRSGQVVYGVGTAIGIIGSGLTLASIIVTSVYGLDQGGGQTSTQIGPALAYSGAGATGTGFIMEATGLGMQHSALGIFGQDPGRGMYASGTLFGILGLCAVGTSYFFGLTNYVDHSDAIAFGTSIAATALLTVGGLLYFSDATRLGQVYRRLTTF